MHYAKPKLTVQSVDLSLGRSRNFTVTGEMDSEGNAMQFHLRAVEAPAEQTSCGCATAGMVAGWRSPNSKRKPKVCFASRGLFRSEGKHRRQIQDRCRARCRGIDSRCARKSLHGIARRLFMDHHDAKRSGETSARRFEEAAGQSRRGTFRQRIPGADLQAGQSRARNVERDLSVITSAAGSDGL